jgi:nitroreductase
VDVGDALRARRMSRSFDGTEVAEPRLAGLCEAALRAPTAGHARGVELVVLAGRAGVARYLEAATDEQWRATAPAAAGLARAGGCVLAVCDPAAYAARYAEPDKRGSGLDDPSAWPVPYWYGDAAFATMSLLLLCEAERLDACFLGAFRNEGAVLAAVGAPDGRRLFGAVLVGRADGAGARAASLDRAGPTRADRVVRGAYPDARSAR